MHVVVRDRAAFPRDKLCAGWITPQVIETLDLNPDDYARDGRTLQPILGFRLSRMGDAACRVQYSRPVSYGILRCEFDHYLLQRSGAELHLEQPVRRIERDGNGWLVDGTLQARVVVGAGGHFCPVARQLGARLGRSEPVIAAREIEFALTPEQLRASVVEGTVPEIYFTPDLQGYGWLFRKGRHLNLGLGRQGHAGLAEQTAGFVDFLIRRGKIPEPPHEPHGHPYLLYHQSPRPLVADGALLVGDAAGLAYRRSGEGIRPAVESGILAAETIIDAGGCFDRAHLAAYEQRCVTRFGPRARDHGIRDLLPPWVARLIASRLLANEWLARNIVLNGWFLHAKQPALRAH